MQAQIKRRGKAGIFSRGWRSAIAFAILLASCSAFRDQDTPSGIREDGKDFSIENAIALESKGDFLAALKNYQRLTNISLDPELAQEAELGCVRCLAKMGKYSSALAMLQPMQENPRSNSECRSFALAGEILIRMGRYADAESMLEISLSSPEMKNFEDAHWIPAACANLGTAYMKNNKFAQSQTLYFRAYEIFEKNGDRKSAEECRMIVETIEKYQKDKLKIKDPK